MNTPDSELMGYVVRMVIPLRREFGRVLDVSHFFGSQSYAAEVINEALTSQDERLHNYANYVQGKLFGPRTTQHIAGSVQSHLVNSSDPLIQETTPSAAALKIRNSSELEVAKARKDAQAKYTTGLR